MPSNRVCMLVRNDCRTDYRVLKQAGSLAHAGYAVTVVGMNTYGPLERELRDGFEIVRVPVQRSRNPLGKAINLFRKRSGGWLMSRPGYLPRSITPTTRTRSFRRGSPLGAFRAAG